MKNKWTYKYIGTSLFIILVGLIPYILLNIYTYIKYSAFIHINFYFMTLAWVLPFGFILVFQEQMIHRYYLRKMKKEIEKQKLENDK